MLEGAQVVIFEISHEKVSQLQQEFGTDVLVIQGDVTQLDDLRRCRDAILARHGKLNALIGAQGIFDGNVPLMDIAPERLDVLFDEIFHVNVKGYMLSARIFFDLLQASGGAMVLTTSTAAYAADGGGLVYTASKGAIRSLVNQLAFEFAPDVRVNGVAPGVILTPLHDRHTPPATLEALKGTIPMGRLGTADLAAAYTDAPGPPPLWAASEVRFTMAPAPRAIMPGATAWQHRNVVSALTFMTSWKKASGMSGRLWRPSSPPALLTRTSMRPKRASAPPAARVTSALLVRSAPKAAAPRPSDSISRTTPPAAVPSA